MRFDSRTTIGRIIRLPFRLIPREAVVPVLTGPTAGLRWVAGSAPHGAWLGILERAKLRHFVESLEPSATVWDVGANVGLYSLASARAVGPQGHVYAFEPFERNVRYLHRHRELNAVRNFTVVPRAVYDRAGTLRMAYGDSPSEFHVSSAGTLEVEAVALDAWYEQSGSGRPRRTEDRRGRGRRRGASRWHGRSFTMPAAHLLVPARRGAAARVP